MSRRGIPRGKSTFRHQPMEEFQPPKDVSTPPSWLDFPIYDSGKTKTLDKISLHGKTDYGKEGVREISTLEIIDPISLPEGRNDRDKFET